MFEEQTWHFRSIARTDVFRFVWETEQHFCIAS